MFKKLLAGMFQPELDSLKAEYERKLADQSSSHEQLISELRRELASVERERDQIKPAYEQTQARSRELEINVSQLQEQINSTQQAMAAQSQEQLQGLNAETDGLKAQLQQQGSELEIATARVSQLESELAAQQALLVEARQNIETLESERTLMQVRAQLKQQEQSTQPASPPVNTVAVAAESAAVEQLIRPPARSKKKVLIVDDAATTRILQKNMLESAGYEVVMGNDGQQGQTLLTEHLPDLVITDVEMPRMNGFELTTWIKQSPYREVPVLMVTSHGDEAFHQKGLQAGADGFVEKKSFNQKTFLEIIQHYV